MLISEQGANINIIDEEAEQSLTNVNLGRHQPSLTLTLSLTLSLSLTPTPTSTPTPTPTPNLYPAPGRDQLLRAMNRYSGNRALILRVFAVLFFFIVIFGAFFV